MTKQLTPNKKIPPEEKTAPEPDTKGAQEKKSGKYMRFVKELALAGLFFIILQGTIAEAFVIPSGSMIPTLQIRDRLLVNKLSYGLRVFGVKKSLFVYGRPQRGEIVVFTRPDDPATPGIDEQSINIIKRVIGLPGETIEVRETTVLVNGKPLKEDYGNINWRHGGANDFGPVKVPDNHVLLLGDNRDESKDSRFWNNPFIELPRIQGRAFFIYWPRWVVL